MTRGTKLMTVKEARTTYFRGLTDDYIRRLARAGNFGVLARLNRVWLLPEGGIIKYLTAHEVAYSDDCGCVPDPMLTEDKKRNLLPFRQ